MTKKPSNRIEFEHAIDTLGATRELSSLAAMESDYADYLSINGNKNDALEYYYRAHEHYKDLGNLQEAHRILWNIGLTHKFLGRFDRALDIFNKFLDTGVFYSTIHNEALILATIGNTYRVFGLVSEARHTLLQSLTLAREENNLSNLLHALISLSKLYLSLGDVGETGNYLAEAQKLSAVVLINETQQHQMTLVEARHELIKDNVTKAVQNLIAKSKILTESDDHTLISSTCLNLSLSLMVSGELYNVPELITRAVNLCERQGNWRAYEGYHILARYYLLQNDVVFAQHAADRAIYGYLDLALYSRINYVEQTMYMVNTSVTSNITKDELLHEFSNVGI